jgi:hypothetical protein
MTCNFRQHTSTASCIDILAPLSCTGKSSNTAEMSGPLSPFMVERCHHSWLKELLDKALQRIGWHCSRWAPSPSNLPKNYQDCGDREAQSCPCLLQNWVFRRRRGSRAESCSRAKSRQWPCKYRGCSCSNRGPGAISHKILLIGRPKVALVFYRIKIMSNIFNAHHIFLYDNTLKLQCMMLHVTYRYWHAVISYTI